MDQTTIHTLNLISVIRSRSERVWEEFCEKPENEGKLVSTGAKEAFIAGATIAQHELIQHFIADGVSASLTKGKVLRWRRVEELSHRMHELKEQGKKPIIYNVICITSDSEARNVFPGHVFLEDPDMLEPEYSVVIRDEKGERIPDVILWVYSSELLATVEVI